MACEDLLAAVSMLCKLAPEHSASRVLRQAVADLGALLVSDQTPKGNAPPAQPKLLAKPAKEKACRPAPPVQSKRRGVSIPEDVAAWLNTTSPTKVAAALSKQRISVYDWRRSGRCAPDVLTQLEALFRESKSQPSQAQTLLTDTDEGDDALELEVLARAAADGMTVEELFDLAGVPDLATEKCRAKVRDLLQTI